MKEQPVVIFAGYQSWELGSGESLRALPLAADANAEAIANQIASMIGEQSANLTLAIPAAWCLSATVSLDQLPARNRRSALLYRLEISLPLTAEDIVADYIFNEPDSALAICTSTIAISKFVNALETAGVAISSIVPGSIYAAQLLLNAQKPDACDVIIWQQRDSVEIFAIRAGRLTSWYVIPATAEDLAWQLEQAFPAGSSPTKVIARSLQPNLINVLNCLSMQLVSNDEQSVEEAFMVGIREGVPIPIDLRRDALAASDIHRAIRKPLAELLVASLVFVISICGVACWRAARLEKLADHNRIQQNLLFTQAFPGHAIPSNIVSRLRSEERGLRANQGSQARALVPHSAMPVLQAILTAIDDVPPQVRLAVDDLKVGDDRFSMNGLVRNRSDLTELTSELGKTATLNLEPPQTEQLAGKGLYVTLTGTSGEESTPK